ncbi:MAG: methylamine utilization protein MauD [Actinomycetota bacterium]|nr:methylamine utilization protein MauD [Actinomycetota bacterium]
MLFTLREVQIPLLAIMLLGGCAAKAWRVLSPRPGTPGTSPTGLVPLRMRRPVMVMMFITELTLGLGLIGTADRIGDHSVRVPAAIVRTATALFFLIAVGALNEMRQRRPDSGCGCFGELSDTPIGLRTITRSGLLCASALATISVPPLRMPSSPAEAELWLAAAACELALLAFLSPEVGEILVRLGYSEPCELRRLPVGRTMSALHSSTQWRKYASQVAAAEPADIWREGCWRFVVYPGIVHGRRVDIVFAVYLQARRPAIRAAVLDAATDEVLGRAGMLESAVI